MPHRTERTSDGIDFSRCGSFCTKSVVLLNGEYGIAEESYNNGCGIIRKSDDMLCRGGCQLWRGNGEKWVRYAMIRYKININITLTENILTAEEKDDGRVTNGEQQHMR